MSHQYYVFIIHSFKLCPVIIFSDIIAYLESITKVAF